MTTSTFFGDTADGICYGESTTYATARETVSFTTNTATTDSIGQRFVTPNYRCWEGFFAFDTSSIPDTDTIDSVTFSLFGGANLSDTDFILEVRQFDWGTTLTTADWVAGSNLGTNPLVATYATSGGWNTTENVFTSQAAFLTSINKTGFTRLMIASDRQRTGIAPTGEERITCDFADIGGTAEDPKLVVNHTAAGAPAVIRRSLLGVGV